MKKGFSVSSGIQVLSQNEGTHDLAGLSYIAHDSLIIVDSLILTSEHQRRGRRESSYGTLKA